MVLLFDSSEILLRECSEEQSIFLAMLGMAVGMPVDRSTT